MHLGDAMPSAENNNASPPLLEVKNLSVSFATDAGEALAVNDVSFHVAHGETFCLVGESGCGKSATAMSIMRLLPDPPGKITAGEILFEGQNLAALPEKTLESIRGSRIGMVFQEPMTALNPVFRIGDQIAESLRTHRGLSRTAALEKTIQLLADVGIAEASRRVRDFPHQMSGGMRQRVMIAMAIACEPTLVIADEPTTALDVTIQKQVLDLLTSLTTRRNKALVLITHDLGVAYQTADRVSVMYSGSIVELAPARDLFNNPHHPYTRGLMLSRPRLDPAGRHTRLPSIPGTVPSPLARPTGCAFRDRCPQAHERCITPPPFAELAPGRFCRCWLAVSAGT